MSYLFTEKPGGYKSLSKEQKDVYDKLVAFIAENKETMQPRTLLPALSLVQVYFTLGCLKPEKADLIGVMDALHSMQVTQAIEIAVAKLEKMFD